MKKTTIVLLTALLVTGCSVRSSVQQADPGAITLEERVRLLEARMSELTGSTQFITTLFDEMKNVPVIQVELIGVPDEDSNE